MAAPSSYLVIRGDGLVTRRATQYPQEQLEEQKPGTRRRNGAGDSTAEPRETQRPLGGSGTVFAYAPEPAVD